TTAVVPTRAPLPVGSKVRVTASDRDRPAGGQSVVVTVTGRSDLLPGGVCLDLSPEAWKRFDPQDAAYRHATVAVVGKADADTARRGGNGPGRGNGLKPTAGVPVDDPALHDPAAGTGDHPPPVPRDQAPDLQKRQGQNCPA